MLIWQILDIFFLLFHALLTVFNLFGWLIKPLRKLNLATLLLTGASWFILGIFFGIGYCPLTDLHWRILAKLGKIGLPDSYISYLVERITGIHLPGKMVEIFTAIFFFLALALSIILNTLDYIRRKKTMPGS